MKNHILKYGSIAIAVITLFIIFSNIPQVREEPVEQPNAEVVVEGDVDIPVVEEISEEIDEDDTIAEEPARLRGSFSDSENLPLTPAHQELIHQYFEAYYTSQMDLEVQPIRQLFENGKDNVFVRLHEEVWRFIIEIRKMQSTNMALTEVDYRISEVIKLEDEDSRWAETDSYALIVDSFKRFEEHPDVLSEEYGVIHYFTFYETDEGLKLQLHLQRGTLYWTVMGDYYREALMENGIDIMDLSHVDEFLVTVDEMLAKAVVNMENRNFDSSDDTPIAKNQFNREAAIIYADQYVDVRNEEWFAYDGYGGNCQNFVSQTLFVSGIPMDTEGVQWKWYGTEINERRTESGRTPSWTGVDFFVDYARDNSGHGLVATVDAAFDSGEIGDVVVLGYDEDWRHSLLISDVIRNDAGEVIDFLVVSNTSNLRDFPLSAYLYTNQMLIKIHGWN